MAVTRSREPLRLREYATTLAVKLSRDERDGLRRLGRLQSLSPTIGKSGHYDVTPGSYVGAIDLGSVQVEIRPKVPIDRVLFLMSYAADPRHWRDDDFQFAQRTSLVEAMIPAFVRQVRRALRRGVLCGYHVEEEALQTVRGRVRFDDQIRRRFGRFPPVEVRFDDFTEDIEENRLIKAALRRLGRMRLRSSGLRRAIGAFDGLLENVSLCQYDGSHLPRIAYSRLNDHYRPAVELSKVILANSSFELFHGGLRSSAFLVDMNEVFEDFVAVALREELGLSERVWPQNARGRRLHLDDARAIRLKPDLSWWEDGACVFIGDVKYKRSEAGRVKHPDLYQLLAYTVATDLPSGLLLYAAGESPEAEYIVPLAGKTLRVTTLDASGSPKQILGRVAEIAERVRETRVRKPILSVA